MESVSSVDLEPSGLAAVESAMECGSEGFLVLDPEHRVRSVNTAAVRMLGMAAADLMDRDLCESLEGLSGRMIEAERSARLKHDAAGVLSITREVDAQPRHLELRCFEAGMQTWVFMQDVTARVRRELEINRLQATMAASQELLRHKNEELNDSLAQLERMNEQLSQADRLKSEFLANTSHELRTPLNSIIGFLQLITEGLCEHRDEEMEYASNALLSAQQLLSLINDVLDIAKIEAGKMTLMVDDLAVEKLFQEVYSLTHVQAAQKGLALTFECGEHRARGIRADFSKTRQVLLNLVSNAIKFTDRGKVSVWVEPETNGAEMMRFVVQDTGIGILPEHQGEIFEKFIQVDGSSTRKYQGTGLGLAISKNLVEMMGGHIGVLSEGEGKGTRMFFSLPAKCHDPKDRSGGPFEHGPDSILPKRF